MICLKLEKIAKRESIESESLVAEQERLLNEKRGEQFGISGKEVAERRERNPFAPPPPAREPAGEEMDIEEMDIEEFEKAFPDPPDNQEVQL